MTHTTQADHWVTTQHERERELARAVSRSMDKMTPGYRGERAPSAWRQVAYVLSLVGAALVLLAVVALMGKQL